MSRFSNWFRREFEQRTIATVLKQLLISQSSLPILLLIIIITVGSSIYIVFFLDSAFENKFTTLGSIWTVFAALLVVIELSTTKKANKTAMLIDMNNSFSNNGTLMAFYEALELDNRSEDWEAHFSSFKTSEIAAFFSFFENIAFLIDNNVVSLRDVDSLFGYRFFSAMHCRWLQETQILPASSSYSDIFRLYESWLHYRKVQSGKGGYGMHTVRYENRYSGEYLQNKLYMYDPGFDRPVYTSIPSSPVHSGNIVFQRVLFPHMKEIMALQEACYTVGTPQEDYYPLNRDELLESMHRDLCIGAFAEEKLIGFNILIKNHETKRNLMVAHQKTAKNAFKALTFDIVFVHPEYRNLGIQKQFIDIAKKKMKDWGASCILAATATSNIASKKNFLNSGFIIVDPEATFFGGLPRLLLKYQEASKQLETHV
ncbi:MAG: GNAT family N-acetyltransferase, partial [Deltaproteobacteria bacterium]